MSLKNTTNKSITYEKTNMYLHIKGRAYICLRKTRIKRQAFIKQRKNEHVLNKKGRALIGGRAFIKRRAFAKGQAFVQGRPIIKRRAFIKGRAIVKRLTIIIIRAFVNGRTLIQIRALIK